ncbi:type VI secretion system protein TssA [Sulfurimonas sp.]|uniref:type VI secretion system protein TssA n=1 Tax=Sulfurimonas sp. TaxID=2022749 RepID=UPI002B472937|nr:type VI secretion system protein TssA [Sulfurimonas sp.]
MSEEILTPINEASVCGSDYKYDDAYLSIESEIDKSNSMLEGVSTDWAKVLYDSENLLKTFTKDTKIFCWWIYATWKQDGSFGLEKSLKLFNKLLLTYEDKLFPKSKKVKISSLSWLEELLNKEILDEKGSLSISVNLEIFLSIFKELETNFALTVKEEIPIFGKLRSAFERSLAAKESKEKISSVSPTSSQNSSEISEINSDADAAKVLRTLKKNAVLLHTYYRSQDSSDIRSIRLVRLLSWLEIDSLPIDEDGKTPLNPPSQMSTDAIDELIAEEKYDEALDTLESLISLSPFWLDGHFMAFNLLSKMGHTVCALEVKNALVAFVKADDTILRLSFKDTTPFASTKLKNWLVESMGEVVGNSTEENKEDEKEQIIEKAYALGKKKKIKEAMVLLQSYYSSAVNREDKFHWRLAKATLAVEFGKNNVALALVEELKRDIDKYSLDEWNPELAAKVFGLYLNSFNRTEVDIEDIHTVYARLCKIDIKQALEIKI